jgi:hypothetical protein
MVSAGGTALASDFNNALTRIIARANRTSNSSTASSSTPVSVLRLDSVPIVSGITYVIHLQPMIFDSTVAGDLITAAIYVSTSGAATSSSTQLGAIVEASQSASLSQRTKGGDFLYVSSTTGVLSILLTVARTNGSGNVRLAANSTFPINMWVTSEGPNQNDTGVDL